MNGFTFRFLLELYTKGSTTEKQVQHTVESVSALVMTTISQLDHLLTLFTDTLPPKQIRDNQALKTLRTELKHSRDLFTKLTTEYQRVKYFSGKGLVPPEAFKIGQRQDVRPDGTNQTVDVEAQYIPVIPMLTKYYDHYSTLPTSQQENDVLASYHDSHRFKASEFQREHPSALNLILYHDDIEVANPLGSRAGVHKLTMFYYSIHGQTFSNLHSIHLAVVCHASDVKQYGYSAVLTPFIRDMKALYSGVQLTINDVPGPILHAALTHVAGDNLAANAILGMVQSFSGGHCCRFCYIAGDEIRTCTHSRDQLARCVTSHRMDVEMVEHKSDASSSTGVKEMCALDDLPYFCGLEATVPDVM